jgi:hypothetical protein
MKQYWYNAVDGLYQQDKEKFINLVEFKAKIIKDVMNENCEEVNSVLIMGFNPMLWYLCDEKDNIEYNLICLDEHEAEFANNHSDLQHVNVLTADEIGNRKFDIVLALDSYFTRFANEERQKEIIAQAHSYTGRTLVTTVKDFKNMKSVDRLIDPPMVINNKDGNHVFVCHREWDQSDKQKFKETMYQLHNEDVVATITEEKRTLYFKQLAKYIHDLGCKDFKISQTQFYKNLFSRSYEYIAVAKV